MGELNDLGLSDIFQILALSQRTGTLVVTTPHGVGQVVFSSGLIVAGGLSGFADPAGNEVASVGERLVALGALGAAQRAAGEVAERRGAQGQALLAACGAPQETLLSACEQFLRADMGRLLSASTGSFCFEPAPEAAAFQHLTLAGSLCVCPRGLKAQYLAMEATRERDELARPQRHSETSRAPIQAPLTPAGRGLSLSQALMDDGPVEDDWSALFADASATPQDPLEGHAQASDASLTQVRDLLVALQASPPGDAPCALLLQALQLHCERGAYLELQGAALRPRASYPEVAPGPAVPVPVAQGSAQNQALQSGRALLQPLPPTAAHQALFSALGGPWHQGAVLIAPWHVAGRVVGLLVGDNPSGRPLTDAPGVDIVVAQAAASERARNELQA